MAVRPYSDLDDAAYVSERQDDSYGETTSGGVAAKIFLWVAWALAAAFWAFSLTTGIGIINSIGPANGPGPGEADAGGVSWLLINFVGGVLILGGALAYGAYRYSTRNKGNDALTEAATHAEYDMIEANGGDDEVSTSPEAHRPLDRDAVRAVRNPGDPSTGRIRP
jgi:hypothetical protein